MRMQLSVLAVWVLLTAVVLAQEDKGKSDQDNIQGTWKPISGTKDGKPIPEEKLKQMAYALGAGKIIMTVGEDERQVSYDIDPSQSPKHFDLQFAGGVTHKGIYELKGDTLKIAHGVKLDSPRPKDFSSNEGVVVAEFKRVNATEGLDGTTVRPAPDEKAGMGFGGNISKPGNYEVHVGDLIELDYTYILVPSATPKKVEYSQTKTGAVAKSSLGFRSVTAPGQAGAGTIPLEGGSSPPPRLGVTRPGQAGAGIPTGMLEFFFDAKKEGEDTVTIKIDGTEYVYKFKVVKK